MRILVLGASGYVGGAVHQALSRRHEVTGTSGSHPVPGLVPLVLHFAGVADLSVAENDPALATALNVRSTEVVLDAIEGKLVFISTDNVFPGTAEQYTEDDERSPVNAYGRSKVAAEDAVLAARRHLVIRLPLMYGPSPYADRFLDRLAKPVTSAQTDVVCAPLYLPGLPALIEALADRTGVMHLSGPDVVTRFELMTAVRRGLDLPTEVVPVLEADSADPTLRPRRLVLRSVRHQLAGAPLAEAVSDWARRR
jgi:dTDP-4-dehydrorhamnose reductase